uniref:Centrosomin N-terminal motif 1 domain-containing protein n=1 Tax=Clastoptera arizonana TaxID=38151 RepID=A0A1B6DG81_9HEMI
MEFPKKTDSPLIDITNMNLPSHLEDISQCPPMSYPGLVSPPKLSPMKPRTMKEYEEELSSLKKENFNCKIRIYFMEERLTQMFGIEDVDLLKANTELKVDRDCLQREVTEKDELIMQANKALHMLKEDHIADINKLKKQHCNIVSLLEEKIEKLEKQLQEQHNTILESTTRFDDSTAMYSAAFGINSRTALQNELENRVKDLQRDLIMEKDRSKTLEELVNKLKSDYMENQYNLSSVTAQLDSVSNKLENAKKEIEIKADSISNYDLKIHTLDLTIGKQEKNLIMKTEELKQKDNILSELNAKISTFKKQLMEVNGTASKDKKTIQKLETEVETITAENQKLKQQLNKPRRNQDPSPIRGVRDRSLGRRSADSQERDLIRQLKESNLKIDKLEDRLKIVLSKLQDSQKALSDKEQQFNRVNADYIKACGVMTELIRNNKQLTRENQDIRNKRDSKTGGQPNVQFPISQSSGQHEINHQLLEVNKFICGDVPISDKECQLQELMLELKDKEVIIKDFEERMSLLNGVESKDSFISALEAEVSDLKSQLSSVKKEDEEKKYILEDLEVKKKQIEQLNNELRKRTTNLQDLVNHELWDKNREIEKLNKQCKRQQMDIISLKQEINARDFNQLSSSLVMKEIQSGFIQEDFKENTIPDDVNILKEQLKDNVEEKRLLCRKVEELKERLRNTPERDCESRLVQSLKAQLLTAKQETEQAEKSKKELMNACALLTTRLQELADFLDSLLPSLGAKKRRIVEQAVQRSRELSRSLIIAADESQLHTSAWTDLQPSLFAPLLPDISTVDFWSGDDDIESLVGDIHNEPELIRLRSQVEILTQEVKQKDGELAKIQSENSINQNSVSKNSYNSVPIWGLNCLEPSRPGDLINLNSMCDNVDREKTDDSLLVTCDNKSDKIVVKSMTPPVKSSNIGKIVITSRKKSILVDGGEQVQGNNCLSESEVWSEPDRDVSKDRIGLNEEKTLTLRPPTWLHADSSDSSEHSPKSSSGGKRLSELRKLQNKVRVLEEMNEALREELTILHQLVPPSLISPNKEDKSTSIELMGDNSLSIPFHLLEEIRNQREKLEASLFHNDYIRRQLEFGLSSLKQGQIHSGNTDGTLKVKIDDLTIQLEKIRTRCQELEIKEKSIENKLEKEQAEWRNKESVLQCEIDKLQTIIQEKTNEILEKQCKLLEFENNSKQQSLEYEQKISEMNVLLLAEENKIQTLVKQIDEMNIERKQLAVDFETRNKELDRTKFQIEEYQIADKKNKQIQEELNSKLLVAIEEKNSFEAQATEFKEKWESCQEQAETTIAEIQGKLTEAEKASVALETGLRVQLEAATKQCSHFEMKLKDLDSVHKRSL